MEDLHGTSLTKLIGSAPGLTHMGRKEDFLSISPFTIVRQIYALLSGLFYLKKKSDTPADFAEKYHFLKLEKRWREAEGKSDTFKKWMAAPYVKDLRASGKSDLMPNFRMMLEIFRALAKTYPNHFKPPYLSQAHGDLHFGNILVDAFEIISKKYLAGFKLIDPKWMKEGNDPLYDFAKLLHNYFGNYDLALTYSRTFHYESQVATGKASPLEFRAYLDDEATGTLETLERIRRFQLETWEFIRTHRGAAFPFEEDPVAWRIRLLFTEASLIAGLFPFHVVGDKAEAKASILYERALTLFNNTLEFFVGLQEQGLIPTTDEKLRKALEVMVSAQHSGDEFAFKKSLTALDAMLSARSEARVSEPGPKTMVRSESRAKEATVFLVENFKSDASNDLNAEIERLFGPQTVGFNSRFYTEVIRELFRIERGDIADAMLPFFLNSLIREKRDDQIVNLSQVVFLGYSGEREIEAYFKSLFEKIDAAKEKRLKSYDLTDRDDRKEAEYVGKQFNSIKYEIKKLVLEWTGVEINVETAGSRPVNGYFEWFDKATHAWAGIGTNASAQDFVGEVQLWIYDDLKKFILNSKNSNDYTRDQKKQQAWAQTVARTMTGLSQKDELVYSAKIAALSPENSAVFLAPLIVRFHQEGYSIEEETGRFPQLLAALITWMHRIDHPWHRAMLQMVMNYVYEVNSGQSRVSTSDDLRVRTRQGLHGFGLFGVIRDEIHNFLGVHCLGLLERILAYYMHFDEPDAEKILFDRDYYAVDAFSNLRTIPRFEKSYFPHRNVDDQRDPQSHGKNAKIMQAFAAVIRKEKNEKLSDAQIFEILREASDAQIQTYLDEVNKTQNTNLNLNQGALDLAAYIWAYRRVASRYLADNLSGMVDLYNRAIAAGFAWGEERLTNDLFQGDTLQGLKKIMEVKQKLLSQLNQTDFNYSESDLVESFVKEYGQDGTGDGNADGGAVIREKRFRLYQALHWLHRIQRELTQSYFNELRTIDSKKISRGIEGLALLIDLGYVDGWITQEEKDHADSLLRTNDPQTILALLKMLFDQEGLVGTYFKPRIQGELSDDDVSENADLAYQIFNHFFDRKMMRGLNENLIKKLADMIQKSDPDLNLIQAAAAEGDEKYFIVRPDQPAAARKLRESLGRLQLGSKGIGSVRLVESGIPTPPFVIFPAGMSADKIREQIPAALRELEQVLAELPVQGYGQYFAKTSNPLHVSVRASSYLTLPGLAWTATNAVMADEWDVRNLTKRFEFQRVPNAEAEWMAWDSFRRFWQDLGTGYFKMSVKIFDELIEGAKKNAGVQHKEQLKANQMKEIALEYKALVEKQAARSGLPMPDISSTEGKIKLLGEIAFGVKRSIALAEDHLEQRDSDALGGEDKMAVMMPMVYGNFPDYSGRENESFSGIFYSHNPNQMTDEVVNGELKLGQGADLADHNSGNLERLESSGLSSGKTRLLVERVKRLSREFQVNAEVEVTFQPGLRAEQGFQFIQFRSSPPLYDGRKFLAGAKRVGTLLPLKGVGAVAGAANGIILSAEQAEILHKRDVRKLIKEAYQKLKAQPGLSEKTFLRDVGVIVVADSLGSKTFARIKRKMPVSGLITKRGGYTSHTADLARGENIPLITQAEIEFDTKSKSWRYTDKKAQTQRRLSNGMLISMDGQTGEAFRGIVRLAEPEKTGEGSGDFRKRSEMRLPELAHLRDVDFLRNIRDLRANLQQLNRDSDNADLFLADHLDWKRILGLAFTGLTGLGLFLSGVWFPALLSFSAAVYFGANVFKRPYGTSNATAQKQFEQVAHELAAFAHTFDEKNLNIKTDVELRAEWTTRFANLNQSLDTIEAFSSQIPFQLAVANARKTLASAEAVLNTLARSEARSSAPGAQSVIHITFELAPFFMSGGVGTAIQGLIRGQGRVYGNENFSAILPLHAGISKKDLKEVGKVKINTHVGLLTFKIYEGNMGKEKVFFLEHQKSKGLGDYQLFQNGLDDSKADLFFEGAIFSRAAVEALDFLPQKFDVVHAHDAMVALTLPMLEKKYGKDKGALRIYTIHHLGRHYQKIRDVQDMRRVLESLELPENFFDPFVGAVHHGEINLAKAGIQYADAVTTVSRSYREETLKFAHGLESLLQTRNGVYFAVPNGTNSAGTYASAMFKWLLFIMPFLKGMRKLFFQWKFGLQISSHRPLIGIISRLVDDKGIGFLSETAERIIKDEKDGGLGAQIAIIGKGEEHLVAQIRKLAEKHPRQIVFINTLGEKEEKDALRKASDFSITASKEEPQGLVPLEFMVEGALSVVHAVGGLRDSVISLEESPERANGFKFKGWNSENLFQAIQSAVNVYHQNPKLFFKMQKNASQSVMGWEHSATNYQTVYEAAALRRSEARTHFFTSQMSLIQDRLIRAAGFFVKKPAPDRVEIWASSTDWFQQPWGRDAFISEYGLLSATGRYEDAEKVFQSFARHEKNGLIPNRIFLGAQGEETKLEYNTVDGPMWFLQALRSHLKKTHNWAFVESLLPTMRNIMRAYEAGTEFETNRLSDKRIGMDPSDGLIQSPAQATWMDAFPEGGKPETPRNGKAVEINALWFSNLLWMADVEEHSGTKEEAKRLRALAKKVKKSFNEKFWNSAFKAETQNTDTPLFDVIEGDEHKNALRPNMLFAIALDDIDAPEAERLLSVERRLAVLEAARNNLLTPYGLRTLRQGDSHYIGYYHTFDPQKVKDKAYHQGTIWPWLIGPYIDALVRVRLDQGEGLEKIQEEIENLLQPLVQVLIEETNSEWTLPEVYAGDPVAHRPQKVRMNPNGPDTYAGSDEKGWYLSGGTRSQAWSVAEIIRVLSIYDGVDFSTLKRAEARQDQATAVSDVVIGVVQKTEAEPANRSELRIPDVVRIRAARIFTSGILAVAMILSLRAKPAEAVAVLREAVPVEKINQDRARAWSRLGLRTVTPDDLLILSKRMVENGFLAAAKEGEIFSSTPFAVIATGMERVEIEKMIAQENLAEWIFVVENVSEAQATLKKRFKIKGRTHALAMHDETLLGLNENEIRRFNLTKLESWFTEYGVFEKAQQMIAVFRSFSTAA